MLFRSVPAALPGVDLLEVEERGPVFGAAFTHDVVELGAPAKSLLTRWVLDDRHKLLVHDDPSQPTELYDLAVDPFEEEPLTAPQTERELRAELDAWWPGRQPNLLVVVTDDQRFDQLGCEGHPVLKTPVLDRLAVEGVRFKNSFVTTAICAASRASLMTSRREGSHGYTFGKPAMGEALADETYFARLKRAGYRTGFVGKWGVKFERGVMDGHLDTYRPMSPPYLRPKDGEAARHLTDRTADEAIRFIEKQGDHPFFLYLPHTMLHHPLGVSEPFRGSSDWGEYGDAIQELDHHFGRLMDCLVRNKLDQKTLIIFASDNGRGPGRNATQPIRGRKLTTYEGGIRVPAICWGPGLGVSRGLVNSEVVRAMDWFPTAATMAGIELPEEMVIDGRDLAPMIKGESRVVPAPGLKQSLNGTVPLRRSWDPPYEWDQLIKRHEYNDAFFYHGSEGTLAGVRWKQWKLVLTPSLQLFDLQTDPGESVPVRNGEMLRKLRGMAILFQQEMMRDSRPPGIASPNADSGQTTISTTVLDEIQQELDVTYQTVGDHNLKMDLFRPKGAWGRLPAIVCIHGGGWHRGEIGRAHV